MKSNRWIVAALASGCMLAALTVAVPSVANTVPTATLFAQLQPPNTLFSVEASDPDGDPLTYEWKAEIECGTFTPNSPTDDQANWNHPSGEPPAGCPHEEGTDHAGVITVIVRDPHGGAVQCRHEGSGSGEQECNIYGEEIDCIVDMRLFDGQFGSLPPDEDELTRGAITVMNLNDTDGIGGVDRGQNPVSGEKDLMKLRLLPPSPNEGGHVTLEISRGLGNIKIFKRASKGDRLKPDPTLQFPTSALPKTLWVEGTFTSALRGVAFHYYYTPPGAVSECADDAYATIVWASLEEALHDRDDLVWSDMPEPPKAAFQELCGGFGLRPRGPEPRGVRNCIGFKFMVAPRGIQDEPGVMFDITRQKRAFKEVLLIDHGNQEVEDEAVNSRWPKVDTPNDDSHDRDETLNPDESGFMFSFDGPGSPVPTIKGSRVRLTWELLFREFVRVRFDGVKPTGNELSGSRVSDLVRWDAHHKWVTNREDVIRRTTGDITETDENHIRLVQ